MVLNFGLKNGLLNVVNKSIDFFLKNDIIKRTYNRRIYV